MFKSYTAWSLLTLRHMKQKQQGFLECKLVYMNEAYSPISCSWVYNIFTIWALLTFRYLIGWTHLIWDHSNLETFYLQGISCLNLCWLQMNFDLHQQYLTMILVHKAFLQARHHKHTSESSKWYIHMSRLHKSNHFFSISTKARYDKCCYCYFHNI